MATYSNSSSRTYLTRVTGNISVITGPNDNVYNTLISETQLTGSNTDIFSIRGKIRIIVNSSPTETNVNRSTFITRTQNVMNDSSLVLTPAPFLNFTETDLMVTDYEYNLSGGSPIVSTLTPLTYEGFGVVWNGDKDKILFTDFKMNRQDFLQVYIRTGNLGGTYNYSIKYTFDIYKESTST